jgi:hypothetical protein
MTSDQNTQTDLTSDRSSKMATLLCLSLAVKVDLPLCETRLLASLLLAYSHDVVQTGCRHSFFEQSWRGWS